MMLPLWFDYPLTDKYFQSIDLPPETLVQDFPQFLNPLLEKHGRPSIKDTEGVAPSLKRVEDLLSEVGLP